jgi:hypothetical protein
MELLTVFTTVTVALITAVFGPIIVSWVKIKMEKKSATTPMHDALETSTLIDNQLEDMIDELECDRVWIAQFHNGGHFYPTGRSIQKFSIFYEKTSPNIPSIQTTFQNIPVSLFPKALSKIYKNGEKYQGKIVWLKEPVDPETGKPKLDKNHPDDSLHTRPVIGLVNTWGFDYTGNNQWGNGKIYDPKNGNTYECTIKMKNNNTLEVRGYIGISLIGRTDTWTRQVAK